MKDLYANLIALADGWDGMADDNPYSDMGLAADALRAALDHQPVSPGGWTCDICGGAVNGATDPDGRPIMQGQSVRHTERRISPVTRPTTETGTTTGAADE